MYRKKIKVNRFNTIGKEEEKAVVRVIKSKNLSGFLGSWGPSFYGGREVQKLENLWKKKFDIKYAVSMNSATSCLYAALGSIGIKKNDEIIVTPTTMTATATGIVLYNAIPIFADICDKTYCINYKDVEKKITKKTKAIVATNIYGFSANWKKLRFLANKYNLILIEDAAQSYGLKYDGKHSGTLGDIGIYSLNRHKHIQSGEGGVSVTNIKKFAEKMQLIRNHGEAVIVDKKQKDLSNLLGFNFRMTELEAAVATEQLKKLDKIVIQRKKLAIKIKETLLKLKYFEDPLSIKTKCSSKICCREKFKNKDNSFYYLSLRFIGEKYGLKKDNFLKYCKDFNIPIYGGGYQPLYLQPLYQKNKSLNNFGISSLASKFYRKGMCPISEKLWFKDYLYFSIQNFYPSSSQLKKIYKVLLNYK